MKINAVKNILEKLGEGIAITLIMWLIITAGLIELYGNSIGVIFLGAIVVVIIFIVIYFYGDKLTGMK